MQTTERTRKAEVRPRDSRKGCRVPGWRPRLARRTTTGSTTSNKWHEEHGCQRRTADRYRSELPRNWGTRLTCRKKLYLIRQSNLHPWTRPSRFGTLPYWGVACAGRGEIFEQVDHTRRSFSDSDHVSGSQLRGPRMGWAWSCEAKAQVTTFLEGCPAEIKRVDFVPSFPRPVLWACGAPCFVECFAEPSNMYLYEPVYVHMSLYMCIRVCTYSLYTHTYIYIYIYMRGK